MAAASTIGVRPYHTAHSGGRQTSGPLETELDRAAMAFTEPVLTKRIPQDPKDVEMRRLMFDKVAELEKRYDDEDTDMLIRVMKIRKSLWT